MKNRQLVFVPEINPKTFLFFFFRGQTGRSYSIREYPSQGGVIISRADSYPYSADEIISMATYSFDAPTHPTDDEAFWRDEIGKFNQQYLKKGSPTRQLDISSTEKHEKTYSFSIQNFKGKHIRSVKDWLRLAPPKMGIRHWKNGRSAKELATAWFGTGKANMPKDLSKLLESHPLTANFFPELAVPEFVTRLDNFKGEHRNHDLILVGFSGNNKIFVSIEAKADEAFGDIISKKGSTNPRSNIYKRMDQLSQAIFGRPVDGNIGKLRYQLLTGIAGTLIEAKKRKADCAVFAVHEFLSQGLDLVKISQNTEDFNTFVRLLSKEKDVRTVSGALQEVGYVKGSKFVPSKIPLLIGKTATKLE